MSANDLFGVGEKKTCASRGCKREREKRVKHFYHFPKMLS